MTWYFSIALFGFGFGVSRFIDDWVDEWHGYHLAPTIWYEMLLVIAVSLLWPLWIACIIYECRRK